MSALKKAMIAATLVTAMATPALAEDFYAAGCVIREGNFIVTTVNKIKDRLQLPVGTPKGDLTAQQTAIAEASEETDVKLKLVSDKPVRVEDAPNGKIVFFECAPIDANAFKGLLRREKNDMIAVMLVDPHKMKDSAGNKIKMPWRYKGDGEFLKKWLPPAP